MRLSDFDYNLPKELIAQRPLKERDQAKLMVINRAQATIEHRTFKDILEYIGKEDTLVLNDTRVLNCRLHGYRPTGGKVEILLLNQKEGCVFNALIKPNRVKLNERIIFNDHGISCQVTSRNEVTFSVSNANAVYRLGLVPLPPYIKRKPDNQDAVYYQTVYARKDGSVAAPTAGLHFTQRLIKEIKSVGINIAYVTLHIGYATFKPVKAENVLNHKMDKEYFEIQDETEKLLNETKSRGARIFAVGTTSCRVLETYALGMKRGYTELFIYPGHQFKMADCLLTNFHLPKTTLLILVSAFAGEKIIKKAYQDAVEKKYRFYSYGDAMLIV